MESGSDLEQVIENDFLDHTNFGNVEFNHDNNNNEPFIQVDFNTVKKKLSDFLARRLLENGKTELLEFFTHPIASQSTDHAPDCNAADTAAREMARLNFIESVLQQLSEKRRYYQGTKSESFKFWKNEVFAICERTFPLYFKHYEHSISSHAGEILDINYSKKRVHPKLLFSPDSDFEPYWFLKSSSKKLKTETIKGFHAQAKGANELLNAINHRPISLYSLLLKSKQSGRKDYIAEDIYNNVTSQTPTITVRPGTYDKSHPLELITKASHDFVERLDEQKKLLEDIKEYSRFLDNEELLNQSFSDSEYIDGFSIIDWTEELLDELDKQSSLDPEVLEKTISSVQQHTDEMRKRFKLLHEEQLLLQSLCENKDVKCFYLEKMLLNEGTVTLTSNILNAYQVAIKHDDNAKHINLCTHTDYQLETKSIFNDKYTTIVIDESHQNMEWIVLAPLSATVTNTVYPEYLEAKYAYEQYSLFLSTYLKEIWFNDVADLLFNKNKNQFLPSANLLCPLEQSPPRPNPNSTNKKEVDAYLQAQAIINSPKAKTKTDIYYSSLCCALNFDNNIIASFLAQHQTKRDACDSMIQAHQLGHKHTRPAFKDVITDDEQRELFGTLPEFEQDFIERKTINDIFLDINQIYYKNEPLICHCVRLDDTNLAVELINVLIQCGLNVFQQHNDKPLLSQLHSMYIEKYQTLKSLHKKKLTSRKFPELDNQLQQLENDIERTQQWMSNIYQFALVQTKQLSNTFTEGRDKLFTVKQIYLGEIIDLLIQNKKFYCKFEPKVATPAAKKAWKTFRGFLNNLLLQLHQAAKDHDIEGLHQWLITTEQSLQAIKKNKSRKTVFLNQLKAITDTANGLFCEQYRLESSRERDDTFCREEIDSKFSVMQKMLGSNTNNKLCDKEKTPQSKLDDEIETMKERLRQKRKFIRGLENDLTNEKEDKKNLKSTIESIKQENRVQCSQLEKELEDAKSLINETREYLDLLEKPNLEDSEHDFQEQQHSQRSSENEEFAEEDAPFIKRKSSSHNNGTKSNFFESVSDNKNSQGKNVSIENDDPLKINALFNQDDSIPSEEVEVFFDK